MKFHRLPSAYSYFCFRYQRATCCFALTLACTSFSIRLLSFRRAPIERQTYSLSNLFGTGICKLVMELYLFGGDITHSLDVLVF